MTGPVAPHTGGEPAGAAFGMQGIDVNFGGVVALSDVSVEAAPNQVVGVIGPNGAGKTTLFNVACGFVQPDAGTMHWQGRELTRLRPHQLAGLGISRTLQGLGLFDRMSVLDNVMVGADRHAGAGFFSGLLALPRSGNEERRLAERAHEVLAGLDVAQYAARLPSSLPYPIRKRVSLARALVSDPDLLLLDEPASGLSDTEMAELGELIRGLSDRMSVMLVEHHMDLVMRVCDHIVVLDFGKVIAAGEPSDVREDPAVLAGYLGDEVGGSGRTEDEPEPVGHADDRAGS